ncbi:hypothetical protein Tco_0985954 [Tanacetum coccineum]
MMETGTPCLETTSFKYCLVNFSIESSSFIVTKSIVLGTDISQKDEKPSKKRQNRTRDGKVCEDEAQSKSSQLREEKATKSNR